MNFQKKLLVFIFVVIALVICSAYALVTIVSITVSLDVQPKITEPYLPPVEGWVCHNMDNMDALWVPYTGHGGWNSWYYSNERFTRTSIYYQVWVGIYWIRGYVSPTAEAIGQFSVIDQTAWLRDRGDPNPYAAVKQVLETSAINFRGYSATKITATMDTHADIPPYENITLLGYMIIFYNEALDRIGAVYLSAVEDNYNAALPMMESLVNGMQIP
ncbi:MAG: hypothetical protein QXN87_06850 [Candidatus Bathyarchaeia archaeon]